MNNHDKYLKPLLFLDFDDVICLNKPFGGYDVKFSLDDGYFGVHRELHENIFDSKAKYYLEQINKEFNPYFVLSTSWRWLFDICELKTVLETCGLSFVSDNLHPIWATPKTQRDGLRAAEIKIWLNLHPEFLNSWVVLDDKLSGRGFDFWTHHERAYVVLCQEGVGITATEYEQLRVALSRRLMQ